MLVERRIVTYMSRGAATVFQVSGNNPREMLKGNCVSTDISFRQNCNEISC
ncbi:MAG: hypothetical protein LBC68_01565 [Prevotellaceae bacterium]|nr:hypothetical protein [Prevotellaceae bacterium]